MLVVFPVNDTSVLKYTMSVAVSSEHYKRIPNRLIVSLRSKKKVSDLLTFKNIGNNPDKALEAVGHQRYEEWISDIVIAL